MEDCYAGALQLLRAAGWREGAGLGAAEQGITTPVAAWDQAGRAGIGTLGFRGEHQKVPAANLAERREATVPDKAQPGCATSGGQNGQQRAVGLAGRRTRRSLMSTQGEQDPETVDRKVKRVKQVRDLAEACRALLSLILAIL